MKYYYVGPGDKTNTQLNNATIHKTKKIINDLRPRLCRDDPLTPIRLPHRRLSSQSLGKYWQLNKNNQKTEHIPTQNNHTQNGALINSSTLKKCMLRDKHLRMLLQDFRGLNHSLCSYATSTELPSLRWRLRILGNLWDDYKTHLCVGMCNDVVTAFMLASTGAACFGVFLLNFRQPFNLYVNCELVSTGRWRLQYTVRRSGTERDPLAAVNAGSRCM